MLDRLERAGLVQRQPNPNDRRGTLIVINKKSTKTVGPLFAQSRKAQDELTARYSEHDLQIITQFLEDYAAIFDSERQKLS